MLQNRSQGVAGSDSTRAIIATEVGDSRRINTGGVLGYIHRSRTRAGARTPQTATQIIKREERMNAGR